MGIESVTDFISQSFSYIDTSSTLSGIVSGTISGLTSVFVAFWISTKWATRFFGPTFELDVRDATNNSTGENFKTLMVTSNNHGFDGGKVYFLVLIEKARFLELERAQADNRGEEMRIHNRGQPRQWDPFVFDNIEYKNIKKKPYVKLSMTITEDMHPASPVPHLLFKVGNTPLEMFYLIRTQVGTFPHKATPNVVERGKLPKIKIY